MNVKDPSKDTEIWLLSSLLPWVVWGSGNNNLISQKDRSPRLHLDCLRRGMSPLH